MLSDNKFIWFLKTQSSHRADDSVIICLALVAGVNNVAFVTCYKLLDNGNSEESPCSLFMTNVTTLIDSDTIIFSIILLLTIYGSVIVAYAISDRRSNRGYKL